MDPTDLDADPEHCLCDSDIFTCETKRKHLWGGREEGEGCDHRKNPVEAERVGVFLDGSVIVYLRHCQLGVCTKQPHIKMANAKTIKFINKEKLHQKE